METVAAKSKVFNDPVHGHIELHPVCVAVVDTPQFQRLRNLAQLGLCYYVFPGASHKRFEHSIGVSHLAGVLVEGLRDAQPDLGISPQDVLCVKLAGLVHDLGHGPFSHAFEHFLGLSYQKKNRARGEGEEELVFPAHEHISASLLDHAISQNGLMPIFEKHGLEATHIHTVKEMIFGSPEEAPADWHWHGPPAGKEFLYQIVANKENGIDVDKFDYFIRDCRHLGIGIGFDVLRLMKFARALPVYPDEDEDEVEEQEQSGKGGVRPPRSQDQQKPVGRGQSPKTQICFHEKEAWNIYELFHTRYSLHKRAYQHRVTTIVEFMINEVLLAADEHLTIPGKDGKGVLISEAHDDLWAYSKLSDGIIAAIELSPLPELAPAQALLRRIQTREFHCYVNELVVPPGGERLKAKDHVPHIRTSIAALSEGALSAEDLIVQIITINYGKRGNNPVDHVRFYGRTHVATADGMGDVVAGGQVACGGVGRPGRPAEDTPSASASVVAAASAGKGAAQAEAVPTCVGQKIAKDRVSFLAPRVFEEQYVRIYTRKPELKESADEAFHRWCEQRGSAGNVTSPAPPSVVGGSGAGAAVEEPSVVGRSPKVDAMTAVRQHLSVVMQGKEYRGWRRDTTIGEMLGTGSKVAGRTLNMSPVRIKGAGNKKRRVSTESMPSSQ